MSNLNIILNGQIVQGNEGESILELARNNGVEIPTLCHDDRLEPFSSCYVCVVEVEGMKGLQPACSTKIREGMRIETETNRVRESRKTALDLLVSNHYADCTAPCTETCPAGVDVQGYISLISKGLYRDAISVIKYTNPLPAICGRVCVRPCEDACRRNLVEGKGVGIDYLKRIAADTDMNSSQRFMPYKKTYTGKKVAVIGAGPGGLTSAYYLAAEGHQVDIFEASPSAGGMLRYGIPPYRLPNDIIEKEVEGITGLGVNIFYNKKLGQNLSYKDLKKDYDSVVLAIGSQNGTRIGCENDDAGNIFSGIDFLRNMEMTGQKYDFSGKKVAVIGGGNTAMDCCRTAMRCGAEEVTILYRRTEKEMPANPIEIHESKLEGVNYQFLTAPARVNKDDRGDVRSLTCFKMQLGEPDASGRRRPVKVEGSEFDIDVDIILAAIGQKTNVNFIEDIKQNSEKELLINKWGDIDANAGTLQTSIESIFACGDGVTGPATLIEAIAQGRRAARSVDQYLRNEPLSPLPYEFKSKKDNFRKQLKKDYEGWYEGQSRQEMPTLDPDKRHNFEEVELGYSIQQAMQETKRCIECGCSELYTCDLKKHATQYGASQQDTEGEFKEYKVRFDHPRVEIDNNKCILCSRCIRICNELVGANALGLVKRGFDTYVAPSMNLPLAGTSCESCGLCIETCPTGAITENVPFKPGPVETEGITTICNYCSVGCQLTLEQRSGFYYRTNGSKGLVNTDGSICRYGKFGYHYLNDRKRITKPLLKENGSYVEISFRQAFDIIAKKIKSVLPDENAFFAGARLTNEEIYLIQKLARKSVKTNNVSSFHYLDHGKGYQNNDKYNVPVSQITKARRIYILGSETNMENAVPGYYAINNSYRNGTPISVITTNRQSSMAGKASEVVLIKSYYYFLKAVNHFILSNNMINRIFIEDHCVDFEQYRKNLLAEDFSDLLNEAGCSVQQLEEFARNYNNESMSVIMYSEKHLSSNACLEIHNLNFLLGKSGKTASGGIALKEKNNSQGLFDMGASPALATGIKHIKDQQVRQALSSKWDTREIPEVVASDQWQLLKSGKTRNAFIFGEDPLGCSIDQQETEQMLKNLDFLVVQDLFMSPTAEMADLILPSSLHFETGGSFTNTQKFIQQFNASAPSPLEYNSLEQINEIARSLGSETGSSDPSELILEVSMIMGNNRGKTQKSCKFETTLKDNQNKKFIHGADFLQKRFDDEWDRDFQRKNQRPASIFVKQQTLPA